MTPLLEQAESLLGNPSIPAQHRGRAACWLARAAFEEAVGDLLLANGNDPGWASMRTKLSCLEAAYFTARPDLAAQAEYAWALLSRASHQHAYELSPTAAECRHLIQLVNVLISTTSATSRT